MLVFTVEAQPDDASTTAAILPSGRYAHGRAHIEQTCAAAGLSLLRAERHRLRIEGPTRVEGWVTTVARPR